MITIDWDAAPEWSDAHGLHSFNGEVKEYWLGGNMFQRLDCNKPFPYGGGGGDSRHNPTRKQFIYVTDRPAPWTGKGVPPVGEMVVIDRSGLSVWPDAEQFIGPAVKVLATYKAGDSDMIVVESPDECSNCCFRAYMAKPAKTPEQIAAEEREAAIKDMMDEANLSYGAGEIMSVRDYVECGFAALYDAGWRKQVTE